LIAAICTALLSPAAAPVVGIVVVAIVGLSLPLAAGRLEPEGITRTEALRELAHALRRYAYYLPRLGSYNAFGPDGLLSPEGYAGTLRPLFVRMWNYMENGHTEEEALSKLVKWTGLQEIEDDIANVAAALSKSDAPQIIEQTAEVLERLVQEEEGRQSQLSEVVMNRNTVAAFGLPMVLGVMPFVMALFVKLTGMIGFLQGDIMGWINDESAVAAAPAHARSFAVGDVPIFWPIVGCGLTVVLAAWFLSDRGKKLRNSVIGLGVFSAFVMVFGGFMGLLGGWLPR